MKGAPYGLLTGGGHPRGSEKDPQIRQRGYRASGIRRSGQGVEVLHKLPSPCFSAVSEAPANLTAMSGHGESPEAQRGLPSPSGIQRACSHTTPRTNKLSLFGQIEIATALLPCRAQPNKETVELLRLLGATLRLLPQTHRGP
ncbi:hypothetical protein DPEC_G00349280 [Dallia pectoralis]|uniref:Uncharacterized protein n=1 Tax=Dallia pectoralis TaxID=75939 RepID=A0ACC2F1D6_DALPE|nr:hypothetical protein DPEC_G00349280 [Dallia pectoralis]